MFTTLFTLALVPTAVGADPLAADTQLIFKGSVAAVGADRKPGQVQKAIVLHLFVARRGKSDTQLHWFVEESGRGRWPWLERFGTLSLNAQLKPSGVGPSILYDYGEDASVRPIFLPLLAHPDGKPLAAGLRWSEDPTENRLRGKWQFHVKKALKRDGRDVWQVEVRNNYGWQRTLWVDRDSPLVLDMRQRMFLGQGDEFLLQLKLSETKKLAGAAKTSALDGLAGLVQMRSKLKRPDRSDEKDLNDEQLAVIKKSLPEIERLVTTGPIVRLVKAANRDLARQSDRAGSLEKLIASKQGKPAPKFRAAGLRGGEFIHDQLRGQVTVLHFWEYKDKPLKQPYGQVGYLDFLYSKRKDEGLKVYGVAVDRRFGVAGSKAAAVRSVRGLVKFMNLRYPLLLDDGQTIKAFGDPRQFDAKLPLFIVIGRDGKIVHYKVGHYKIDRLRGLKELNAIVSEQLKVKK